MPPHTAGACCVRAWRVARGACVFFCFFRVRGRSYLGGVRSVVLLTRVWPRGFASARDAAAPRAAGATRAFLLCLQCPAGSTAVRAHPFLLLLGLTRCGVLSHSVSLGIIPFHWGYSPDCEPKSSNSLCFVVSGEISRTAAVGCSRNVSYCRQGDERLSPAAHTHRFRGETRP